MKVKRDLNLVYLLLIRFLDCTKLLYNMFQDSREKVELKYVYMKTSPQSHEEEAMDVDPHPDDQENEEAGNYSLKMECVGCLAIIGKNLQKAMG